LAADLSRLDPKEAVAKTKKPRAGKNAKTREKRTTDSPFSMDFGGVHYDPKNPANLLDLKNKQQFLCSAAQHVPRFADSLLEATVPLIVDQIKSRGSLPKKSSPEYNDFWSRAIAAIRDWARSFHIDVNWIVDEAWGIVIVAIDYFQKKIEPLKAFGTWRRSLHPGTGTHPFLLPAWNPHQESPGAYAVRANKAWTQVRKEYIATKKKELSEAGLKGVPRSREREFSEELRFEWAVLYRCAGKSIEELADTYREDAEAIRISVSRILKDLGLAG
jgi:hypothetical protein